MSFLRDYIHFTSGNECPENYRMWSGIAAMSAIVSRRVWIDMGLFRIYPNLYVILLGEPGNYKTTAMDMAKDLVRDLGTIPFSAESQTKESLTRYMRDNCIMQYTSSEGQIVVYTPITIFVTELSHFFGFNSGTMIDFLTTIYGEKRYEARTKNKGDDIIEGPYVTMLACTTPEWITTYLKSDIIGGGFTRRVVFVNEPTSDDPANRIAFPVCVSAQKTSRNACIAHARALSNVSGEIRWTNDARKFYEEWYKARVITTDRDIRGFERTKHVQILKVAMLVSLSESTECLLKPEHIQVAMGMIDRIQPFLKQVFSGIGKNELNVAAQQILAYLTFAPEFDFQVGNTTAKRKGILKKDLQGRIFKDLPGRSTNEFAGLVEHLKNTGQIEEVCTSDDKGVTRVWVLLAK